MNKKKNFTIIAVLIYVLATGQANKPAVGDFGLRYGVCFNGTPTQTLAFSGILKDNCEVGSFISVQYSQANTEQVYNASIYITSQATYLPVTETSKSHAVTIGINISPFLLYHFLNKSNLDLYAGANVTIGTGSIRLPSTTNAITEGTDYYKAETNTYAYPPGYQVGAGLITGARYFFYKRLALGINASLGGLYSGTKGTGSSINTVTNSGANNTGVPYESTTSYSETNTHSFSLKTGSSISLTLSFYMPAKRKAKRGDERL